MHNYHFELIRAVDIALLGVLILVSLVIVISALIKDYLWNIRTNRLLSIKMYIYPLVAAGKYPASVSNTPFIARITSQQFLDIEMNRTREAVSFNDAERNFLISCFINPKRVAMLEKAAIKSRDKVRRIEAILCLGYSKAKSSTDILKKSLYSKDEDLSYFSIIALGQIKTTSSAKVLLEFLRKVPSGSYKIVAVLEDFPPDIVDDVITLVDDPNPRVEVWGMKLLSRFAAERYVEKIEKLTNNKNAEVRASACACLGSIGRRESKEALLKCLSDESWLVRMHAVRALSRVLGDECVSKVMYLINDASWSVNSAVRDAMADHIEASLPYIEQFLAGEDIIAQKYSIEVLRDSGYIMKILKAIISANEKERAYAKRLLESIVRIKAHFALEAGMSSLDADTQTKVLAVLNGMDRELAEHVKQKITYKMREP